ncbi:MAG TPA: carboxylesterase family protein [Candidatus Merdenecus merdavium]|nr:carboxylesterase family protein [Candidatus Merdenecus merdavium]
MKVNKIFKDLVRAALPIALSSPLLAFSHVEEKTDESEVPVKIQGGKITGTLSEDSKIRIYKGIPYAAPPVGQLRWKAPQPVVPWEGIKECIQYSANAIQPPQNPFMFWSEEFIVDTTKGYSEDCLYLNVWTKSKKADKKRPVIVYIHGGANVSGGASCDVYDGTEIAKKGIVYVSINYRVGILGFLAHPSLSEESADGISGNYAILDQITALKWVKNNIDKFGGDPDHVTVVGQSAGAFNVNSLVISPLAKGLFKNAFTMSFNIINSEAVSLSDKEEEGLKVFEGKTLEEMRAMSTDELLKLNYVASTCVDGLVFTGSALETYKAKAANNVTLITGMVDGDSILFPILSSGEMFGYTKSMTKTQYETAVKEQFGAYANECLKAYPPLSDDALDVFHQVNRDGAMALQNYLAKARSLQSVDKTYIYNFSHVMPGVDSANMKAFHTSDVPYWLNYFSPLREEYWAKIDYKLGEQMSNYLVNFAETGNPNGKEETSWKPYNGKMSYLNIGDEISIYNMSDTQVKFWEGLFASQLGL